MGSPEYPPKYGLFVNNQPKAISSIEKLPFNASGTLAKTDNNSFNSKLQFLADICLTSLKLNFCFSEHKRIHRVVFTGGPCAGKTTCINRIKTFFESIGWKVFCVPETATFLLTSGLLFYELDEDSKHCKASTS